jgi:hypothetical protein
MTSLKRKKDGDDGSIDGDFEQNPPIVQFDAIEVDEEDDDFEDDKENAVPNR